MIYHVKEQEENWTLRRWARYNCDLPYPQLQELVRKKLIKIKNQNTRLETKLNKSMQIFIADSIELPNKEKHVSTEIINDITIFENNAIAIIEKPYGISAQGEENSLADLTDAYMVQRLDKTTTGLMIIAKTKLAAAHLSEQLHNHTIEKRYLAVCTGEINDSGVWTSEVNDQSAITYYKKLKQKDGKLLIELNPQTGRKHQLRVHCFRNRIPILGDQTYGGQAAKRIYLHSAFIKFVDPETNEILTFESDSGFVK